MFIIQEIKLLYKLKRLVCGSKYKWYTRGSASKQSCRAQLRIQQLKIYLSSYLSSIHQSALTLSGLQPLLEQSSHPNLHYIDWNVIRWELIFLVGLNSFSLKHDPQQDTPSNNVYLNSSSNQNKRCRLYTWIRTLGILKTIIIMHNLKNSCQIKLNKITKQLAMTNVSLKTAIPQGIANHPNHRN